jgi:hypothetical protein
VSAAENPGLQRLADKFACLEKPATSRMLNSLRIQATIATFFSSDDETVVEGLDDRG